MENGRKIPWATLALQTIYLSIGLVFHMFIRHEFRHIYEEMLIGYAWVTGTRLVLDTPLVIAGLVCMFFFFLWAWKYNRLENKFIVTCVNVLPIVFIYIAFMFSYPPIMLIENLGA